MLRQREIVQEPMFFTLRNTSALTIAYIFQIFLHTAALLLFPTIDPPFLFTAIILFALSAFFTALFFMAIIRRNSTFLRISLLSQISAFLYTMFTMFLIATVYRERILRLFFTSFLLFLILFETPLIVYLTKRGSGYFKRLHNADHHVQESSASIKIDEQTQPKEVPELSVTDLCRQQSSDTESCTSNEEIDEDSVHLPAPVNKFHSISLDSYHDCQDN